MAAAQRPGAEWVLWSAICKRFSIWWLRDAERRPPGTDDAGTGRAARAFGHASSIAATQRGARLAGLLECGV